MQRHLLRGNHDWQDEPDDKGDAYLLGMDVGGEERPGRGDEKKLASKRDSTIITVARVSYNELDLPKVEIVHQYWFNGMHHSDQYAATCQIMQLWNARQLVIDATGLGEALASLLIDKFGDQRVTAFKFSRMSKSKLTYQFLSMINTGRLKMYQRDGAPEEIYKETWKQLKLARYSIPGQDLISMHCDSNESHDDFLMSLALCTEAVKEWSVPAVEAQVIKPRHLYGGESRY